MLAYLSVNFLSKTFYTFRCNSWAKENKLDQLQYVRKILTTSYLSAVAAISPHELSVARVACAKTIFLTIVFDDLFDVAGSKGELESLIGLVER